MALVRLAVPLLCLLALCAGQESTEEATTEEFTRTRQTTTRTTTPPPTTAIPALQTVKIFTDDEMLFFRARGVVFETVSDAGFVEGSVSLSELLGEISSLKTAIVDAQATLTDSLSARFADLNAQFAGTSTTLDAQVSTRTQDQLSAATSIASQVSSSSASLGTTITTTSNSLNLQIAGLSQYVGQHRTEVDDRITSVQSSLIASTVTINQRITDTAAPIAGENSNVKILADSKVDTATYSSRMTTLDAQVAAVTLRANTIDTGVSDTRTSITQASTSITNTVSTLTSTRTEVDKLGVPVKIEVQSAGNCNGNFFRVWINNDINAVLSATGAAFGRGINTLTIDMTTGLPLVRNCFDTWATASEATRMVTYLNGLADGTMVVFGIQDEAMNNMSDELRRLLSRFGSKLIYHIDRRESWAMIGFKGAAPGSVAEDHGGDDFVFADPCAGTGRATARLAHQLFTGKLAWYNLEYNRRAALEAYTKIQRKVFYAVDATKDNWVVSRRFQFSKYHDDSILKITWFDNFRCEGANGVSCRWDVYIDGLMCATDIVIQTAPLRMDMHAANSLNIHRGSTIQGYCKMLSNRTFLRAGTHQFDVWERVAPRHPHGNPYLGWVQVTDLTNTGGNSLTVGGTYSSITIEEVF